MIIAIGLGLIVLLLFLGFSTSVALGFAVVVCFVLTPGIPLELIGQRIAFVSQNYVFVAVALFVFYGRLCAEMDVRARVVSNLGSIFGRSGLAVTGAEAIASFIQPDTAGDALLQRNDEAAATVNRLRLAGLAGDIAIGQAAALAFLRAVIPPSILLIIAGELFGLSVGQLFISAVPLVVVGSGLLLVLALPMRSSKNESSTSLDAKRDALLWLVVPILTLGVIFVGLGTPSEAAALSVALALMIGLIQRQISGPRLLRATLDALQDIGAILLVWIFAEGLAFVIAFHGGSSAIADWSTKYDVSMVIPALLLSMLISSMLIGPLPTFFVLGPLLFPTILKLNLNPTSFALAFVIATALGLLVPPTGTIFATLIAGTRESYYRVALGIGYFGIVGVIMLGIAALFPIEIKF